LFITVDEVRCGEWSSNVITIRQLRTGDARGNSYSLRDGVTVIVANAQSSGRIRRREKVRDDRVIATAIARGVPVSCTEIEVTVFDELGSELFVAYG